MIAEARQHAVHWMEPDDASESEIIVDLQLAVNEQANHIGGIQCLLADGGVRFLSAQTSEKVLRALVTRSGGDDPVFF